MSQEQRTHWSLRIYVHRSLGCSNQDVVVSNNKQGPSDTFTSSRGCSNQDVIVSKQDQGPSDIYLRPRVLAVRSLVIQDVVLLGK